MIAAARCAVSDEQFSTSPIPAFRNTDARRMAVFAIGRLTKLSRLVRRRKCAQDFPFFADNAHTGCAIDQKVGVFGPVPQKYLLSHGDALEFVTTRLERLDKYCRPPG